MHGFFDGFWCNLLVAFRVARFILDAASSWGLKGSTHGRMIAANANICKALLSREVGGRRPATATVSSRKLYQQIYPSSKVQQLDIPEVHICRFSPCGQYLVCMAGGFTQLVVYRFTGPRVSWQGEVDEAELAARLADFNCFFSLLYRVPLAPAGEVLARDVVLFPGGVSGGSGSSNTLGSSCSSRGAMGAGASGGPGGGMLLLASHSPFTQPAAQTVPPAAAHADNDLCMVLPYADSITLHLVRLSDGVRLGGSRFEGELVDLSGRPGCLGISVHEDIIAVLALRSQTIHLLQVLRGGEEVVPVRCVGPHVAEDDELVVRTAEEAEERWRAARKAAGREAGGRGGAGCGGLPLPAFCEAEESVPAPLPPPLRRSINGDLVRSDMPPPPPPAAATTSSHANPVAAQSTQAAAAVAVATAGGMVGAGPLGATGGRTAPDSAYPLASATAASAGAGAAARAGDVHGAVYGVVLPPDAPTEYGRGAASAAYVTAAPAAGGVSHGGSGTNAVGQVLPSSLVPVVSGSGSDPPTAPVHAPLPLAVLYPPSPAHPYGIRSDAAGVLIAGSSPVGSGAAGAGSDPALTAVDMATAAAHQAAVRRQVRQAQYEQLAAQGGPSQPPPPPHRRRDPSTVGFGTPAIHRSAATPVPTQPNLLPTDPNGSGVHASSRSVVHAVPPYGSHGSHQRGRPSHAASRPHQALAGGSRQGRGGGGVADAGGGGESSHLPVPVPPGFRSTRTHLLGNGMGVGPSPPNHHHQQDASAAGGPALPYPMERHQPPQPPASQFGAPRGGANASGVLPEAGGGGGQSGSRAADGGGRGGGGGAAFITGIKQRLLAHLYGNCLRAHGATPWRLQREALALFRHFDTYRSLFMRKVFLLDRSRLLIDMRTPAGADVGSSLLAGGPTAALGGGPGPPPTQFFLLFDLQSSRVISFRAGSGERLIDKYVQEATCATEPWSESLPLWDRFTYDVVLSTARSVLQLRNGPGSAVGPSGSVSDSSGAAAPDCASAGRKLMQLMPPLSGSCGLSSSPYLDTRLYAYDDRVISPYIRTRPCLEQPISFRPRNRPDRSGFRLDPGPYEVMVVRDRRLARSVTHLFHPYAPFVMAVFSAFQQNTLNINFRI